jgi:hypothetical protein
MENNHLKPVPRVLHTHLNFEMLPKNEKEKIVLRKTQKIGYSNRFVSWQLGEKEKKTE